MVVATYAYPKVQIELQNQAKEAACIGSYLGKGVMRKDILTDNGSCTLRK